eukprot:TRINITY_DN9153_c0_g2_i1.p1 TRINITY_DN9153_c0_g2~~TRINITY_DN9153_c0_g2_i1.p1  ORF type:complete len:183 (-),score=35.93 TRINITY_DN9153_c0_g2_i1:510-1010(-)
MAKVTANFCLIYNNTEMYNFATRCERLIYFGQWSKNTIDVTMFLLVTFEPENTWIYYLLYFISANFHALFFMFFLTRFGNFLTDLSKKSLEEVSSSANNVSERKQELRKLEELVKQTRDSGCSYIILTPIPMIWWVWTRANFSSNPPMVPRNFFDYFARTGFIVCK